VNRCVQASAPLGLVTSSTTMVGITICIVIWLQESVVACVLQPWSGGKDPDRYTFGSKPLTLCD
jgi:hypothetical protein